MISDNIITLLKENTNFLITTHISPDGDGIGSVLALKRGLESLHKKAIILNHSLTPKNLRFLLKNQNEIFSLEEFERKHLFEDYVSIVADMGCFERLGSVLSIVEKAKKILVIDHHIVNVPENVLALVDNNASATGEVVFDLLNSLNVRITKDIAEPLYVAIETDTGGFRFPGTTPKTHLVVSKLLELNVNPSFIYKNLYENEPPVRLKVMGEVFSTLSLYNNNKIAVMELRQEMLNKLNARIEDGDDLVNYLMIIEGVEVGFYFKEISDNKTKVSSRSRGKIDLDKFLSQWGGGGHPMAAGLLMNENISTSKSIIISKISEIINNND